MTDLPVTDLPASKAFATLDQERRADTLGMWIFLGTEAMLFGAVLVGYFILRLKYHAAFAGGSAALSLPLGGINTAILLTSSFALAVGVEAARTGVLGMARRALAITALLGAAFVAVKAYEYWDDVERGLLPLLGPYRYAGPDAPHAALFFNLYLAMTGMHAVHLLIGIALIGWLALPHRLPAARSANRIEMAGLYWHFVDIVWILLFPLLYLVQR
jgi:cytochrome c oxidase subunit 3